MVQTTQGWITMVFVRVTLDRATMVFMCTTREMRSNGSRGLYDRITKVLLHTTHDSEIKAREHAMQNGPTGAHGHTIKVGSQWSWASPLRIRWQQSLHCAQA